MNKVFVLVPVAVAVEVYYRKLRIVALTLAVVVVEDCNRMRKLRFVALTLAVAGED